MLIQLEYTRRDGTTGSRIVNTRLIDSVEADPRPDVLSKSIVRFSDGLKLYCTNTPEQIMQQTKEQ